MGFSLWFARVYVRVAAQVANPARRRPTHSAILLHVLRLAFDNNLFSVG